MVNAAVIMAELETDLMVAIINSLNRGAIGTAQWQALKIRQLAGFNKRIEKLIRKGTENSIKAAKREIVKAQSRSVKAVDNIAKNISYAQALPANADESIRAILTTWERSASVELGNVGSTLLQAASDQYKTIVEKVTAQALIGQVTGRQAMNEISRNFGMSGLKAFRDKAGREWSPEAYSQMVVRSNVRNVATDTQIQRTQQHGLDLVEVDSHAGARPGCEPYQGKIYSISGKDENYPALSTTSYGDLDGLFGINCGHNMYPYLPGTERTYKPYPKIENEETYKKSQRQRYLERQIRAAKRQKEVATGEEDKRKAQALLANRQKAMRNFIDDTGRTRLREREQIQ